MAAPLIALAVVLTIMIFFPMWITRNSKRKNKIGKGPQDRLLFKPGKSN
jgi:hypothetical protein